MKCPKCSTSLTPATAFPSVIRKGGFCRQCHTVRARLKGGFRELNRQRPGASHTFTCGCTGVLPEKRQYNIFAVWTGHAFSCRVARILSQSRNDGRKRGYVPIDPNTPHWAIRKMMQAPICERFGEALFWDDLRIGSTPHLHHSHTTGEAYGFTHPHCNPHAMEREIERLKEEIKRLKQ